MNITMLGTGLIGRFYTQTIQRGRSADKVTTVYSRTQASADRFAREYGATLATTDMTAAIADPRTDLVVVGLPNYLHEEAVIAAAKAGKGVLCTKPLGRTAAEAYRMLQAVEKAGVFAGYLEDLVYTPKTLKALQSVAAGDWGPCCGRARVKRTLGRIATGFGINNCRVGAPSSIWAAIVSKSPVISSANTFAPSKCSVGATPKSTLSMPRIMRWGWCATKTAPWGSLSVAGRSGVVWICVTKSVVPKERFG